MIGCGHQHSLCTKCFANKVKERGCDHKLKCCCGKRDNVFTLITTQFIEGSVAIYYYDYTIKKEEKRIRSSKIL